MIDRYEFNDGKHKKFWQIAVDVQNICLIISYGRIGTVGQKREVYYDTIDQAENERITRVLEKTRKGYILVSDSCIGEKICLGEHVWEVARGFCNWLNKCLKEMMSPSRFSTIWDKFMNEQECSKNVPGKTGEEYWIDNLEFSDNMEAFYKQAFEINAKRFQLTEDNSFCSLVIVK